MDTGVYGVIEVKSHFLTKNNRIMNTECFCWWIKVDPGHHLKMKMYLPSSNCFPAFSFLVPVKGNLQNTIIFLQLSLSLSWFNMTVPLCTKQLYKKYPLCCGRTCIEASDLNPNPQHLWDELEHRLWARPAYRFQYLRKGVKQKKVFV